jgi:hypothetical protein
MSLKEEVKKIFEKTIGKEAAKAIDVFEDPEKYPDDFIEEAISFLANFIGKEAAEKKFEDVIKKYKIGGGNVNERVEKNSNCYNHFGYADFGYSPALHF